MTSEYDSQKLRDFEQRAHQEYDDLVVRGDVGQDGVTVENVTITDGVDAVHAEVEKQGLIVTLPDGSEELVGSASEAMDVVENRTMF